MAATTDKPLFVGNLDPYMRPKDLQRLFGEKGTVEKIDLKNGFAFVFMPNTEEAEAALEKYNGCEISENKHRRMKVEWAKGDGSVKKREDARRDIAQNNPCDTLFVVNFDPRTRTRELEKVFEPFGKIKRVEIVSQKNYAFVQFSTVEEATEARLSLNGKQVNDRELTVEYVARGNGRDRSRSRSPRRRSRSPRRRDEGRNRDEGRKDEGRSSYKGRSRSRSRDRSDRDKDRNRDRDRGNDRDRDRGGDRDRDGDRDKKR